MIPESIKSIKISQFDYLLRDAFIAQKPLPNRDEAKLLIYKNGEISHHQFNEVPNLLEPHTQLILNNAKVIPARLKFKKESGASIEVFLLEPISPHPQMELALQQKHTCVWQCMIGNLKRWKEDDVLSLPLNIDSEVFELKVELISRAKQWVKLSWEVPIPFSHILEISGKTPLPPYIKREANEQDLSSYQTVFAKQDGAVAAPTAGLHFSDKVLDELKKKSIKSEEVTLYVGAGTFAPVNAEHMVDHDMHAEMISVNLNALLALQNHLCRIAVGTTSLRTLETLYWIGVKLFQKDPNPFEIEKLYPYQLGKPELSWYDSIQIIIDYLKKNQYQTLSAKSAIMIMPGYKFKSCDAMFTNFHYPNTTLMMLVAAFIGDDWQKVYQAALDNEYRFLSYGDSSLLWRKNTIE
jgi:S-adenosylmethionine:tRNA ribosyltransferase-isomerase